MIFPDLTHIKIKRKQLDLTQYRLAKEAGISQSLIAKIESGKAEASYEKVKRIFETLDSLGKKESKKAKDIMTKKIIFVNPNNKVKKAAYKMKKYNISQLPVFSKNKQIGSISESGIIAKMPDITDINKKSVQEIMEESFPTVNKDMPISALIGILKEVNAILVIDKDKIIGIISKSDVI